MIPSTQIPHLEARAELAEAAIEQVRSWVAESKKVRPSKSAKRLAGVLKDPNGLKFTVGFVDGVVRPEDLKVAAANLRSITHLTPKFLPLMLRSLIKLGGVFAPVFPGIVVPIARKALRGMVAHLIIDASDRKLGKSLRKLRKFGARLNINLLGESVLGEQEAQKRLRGTSDLLSRKDVDYVSIKVSSATKPHSPWAFDEAVTEIVERLTPLYEIANRGEKKKFINLDMEEYRDLDLTMTVFKRILDQEQFKDLPAGIVLQAYLPDALGAMIELQQWASLRVDQGGAPIKVRLVKGANLPMEKVDAELHGWPIATVESKQAADTNYKRVLNYALTPDRIRSVNLGVAGHNLFDLAFAWILANQRQVADGVDFEMLLGMAQEQAKSVKTTTSKLVLYTPVVHPQEFDVAIAYLIRRLEEGAAQENFMSAVFDLADESFFNRERDRFLSSLEDLDEVVPIPNRLQDRNFDAAVSPADGFSNAPDTDPAIGTNRRWAYSILRSARNSNLGVDLVEKSRISTRAELDDIFRKAQSAAAIWSSIGGYRRAKILHDVGVAIERNRAALIEVMVSEAGKTLDQADTEISEAIDFAHYYAEQAIALEKVDGAQFVPHKVTVVTPPWNFPVAIPAGSALAALAAGSAVIFKPAGLTARSGALVAKIIREAGVPSEVLQDIQLEESQLGQDLISDSRVDQLILTGGYETAVLFKEFNPNLKLLAETSGKNAIIITPHADLDQAAKDLAYSAFGHAGQKCSAASIAILVGSVAKSQRFRRQLQDAVSSMKIDYPTNPMAKIGPLIAPPEGKLLEGLTSLGKKERWVLKPQQLDESGRLWSPGIKEKVKRGSTSHMVEYFGPLLSIMTAKDLDEAIEIQNAVDYGLTAGIHSLNKSEIETWIEKVQAGNLYVNRGITGAIVQRQPFGGWKKSSVGPGAKAGGPNYLSTLGTWQSTPAQQRLVVQSKKVNSALALAAETVMPDTDLATLTRASESDEHAIKHFFGEVTDPSNLSVELNRFRYVKADTELRISATATSLDSWRAILAFLAVGGKKLSVFELPGKLADLVRRNGIIARIQTDAEWVDSLRGRKNLRVRFVGQKLQVEKGSPLASPNIAVYWGSTVESGRIELLPYFKEQAISITAHRFGNPAEQIQDLKL